MFQIRHKAKLCIQLRGISLSMGDPRKLQTVGQLGLDRKFAVPNSGMMRDVISEYNTAGNPTFEEDVLRQVKVVCYLLLDRHVGKVAEQLG
jgi:hypothetical protein